MVNGVIVPIERPQGEWEETTEPFGNYTEVQTASCSVCHESFILDEFAIDDIIGFYKFCPFCGARMKTTKGGAE